MVSVHKSRFTPTRAGNRGADEQDVTACRRKGIVRGRPNYARPPRIGVSHLGNTSEVTLRAPSPSWPSVLFSPVISQILIISGSLGTIRAPGNSDWWGSAEGNAYTFKVEKWRTLKLKTFAQSTCVILEHHTSSMALCLLRRIRVTLSE